MLNTLMRKIMVKLRYKTHKKTQLNEGEKPFNRPINTTLEESFMFLD